MSRTVTAVVIAVLVVLTLPGCGKKYIKPTDSFGRACMQKIETVKQACISERRGEVASCERRRAEQEEILGRQYDQQAKGLSKGGMLALSISNALKLEDCRDVTAHCKREYNTNFKRCGGRIE